jgi:hypothetical protein
MASSASAGACLRADAKGLSDRIVSDLLAADGVAPSTLTTKTAFADGRIRFRYLFIAFEDQKQAIYHVQSAKDLTTVRLTRDHLYPSECPARFSGSKISHGGMGV